MQDSEEAVCSMLAGRDLQQQDEREYSLHILHNNCDDTASEVRYGRYIALVNGYFSRNW
jgi:hypothetical protein